MKKRIIVKGISVWLKNLWPEGAECGGAMWKVCSPILLTYNIKRKAISLKVLIAFLSPSLRTQSPKPADWEFEAVGLNTSHWYHHKREKKEEFRKCPSHFHIAGLKGRCTKGWGHVRDIGSPSRLPHIFAFEPSHHFLVELSTRLGLKIVFLFFSKEPMWPQMWGWREGH